MSKTPKKPSPRAASERSPARAPAPLPDRVPLNVPVDVNGLRQDLAHLEASDWVAHFVTRNYEGEWSVMPLRGPRGETHPIRMAYSDPSCTAFEDTPFLGPCAAIRALLDELPFELHAVRLMALAPGSRIREHRDFDLDVELGALRLHVPIRTHADVHFTLNGSRVVMQEGECWYLRLSDPHAVINASPVRRVHLVIDAPATPEARAFLTDRRMDAG